MVDVETTEDNKAPCIILIHGANASPTSFNYIKSQLPPAEYHVIDYSVLDDFYSNLDKMVQQLDPNKSYHVFSHSMGGIFAVHLTQFVSVRSSISVSTPFGGASVADWAKYMMPNYQLFRDVSTRSLPITELKRIQLEVPWKQVVTTRGSVPWIKSPNDGVVSVDSMTIRDDVDYVFLNESHNEVLMSDELVQLVRSEFFG